jgi:hypothetical protein
MAYIITEGAISGLPPITDTRLTTPVNVLDQAQEDQANLLGRRVRAFDPTYGEGEFIYLRGVASTIVGAAVIYDEFAKTTKLAVAGDRGPVAIAMSINLLNFSGWYQISGAAVIKAAAAVAAGAAVYWTATPGAVDDAVVATDKVSGMRFKTADGTPAAGFAVIELDRPSANGDG